MEDDEGFFPCVCCGTGWQTDSGFCEACNREKCPEHWAGKSGDGGA